MRSLARKRLLLINGFTLSQKVMGEFLSKSNVANSFYLSYPFGVLTLAGWSRQEFPNFDIQIIDAVAELHKYIANKDMQIIGVDEFVNSLLDKVKSPPDFIGFSMSCSNGHRSCLNAIRLCKKKWPASKMVVGGTNATMLIHRIIGNPDIDYVVRGQGDIAFMDLLYCLTENISPEGINGVILKPEKNYGVAESLTDLNKIPALPYDLVDMEYLMKNEATSPIRTEEMRSGAVFMTRGCPFQCAYCAADQIHGRKVLFTDIKKVVDSMEYQINNFKANTICILDDLFGLNKKYFYELFEEIERRNLKFRLVASSGLPINLFDEDMIDVLIKYGLKTAGFPLESGSKWVQENVIGKKVDLDRAIRLINYARKKGLFVTANIVLGSPGETKEMMNETYEFISKLVVDWIMFFNIYPYPGTKVTRTLLARGDVTEDDLMEVWENSVPGCGERIFDTAEFSGKELTEITSDFNIRINFFSNYNFRTGNYSRALLMLDKVVKKFSFQVVALACRAKCYRELGREQEALVDIDTIYQRIKEIPEAKSLFEKYQIEIEGLIQ